LFAKNSGIDVQISDGAHWPVNAAQTALKYMRVLHIVFLFTIAFYVWIPFQVAPKRHLESPLVIVVALALWSLAIVGLILFFYARRVAPAEERLRSHPDDKSAAEIWKGGLTLCIVCCESIVVFGFALRMLGVAWKISAPFYAVGALLLLACRPKLELLPE